MEDNISHTSSLIHFSKIIDRGVDRDLVITGHLAQQAKKENKQKTFFLNRLWGWFIWEARAETIVFIIYNDSTRSFFFSFSKNADRHAICKWVASWVGHHARWKSTSARYISFIVFNYPALFFSPYTLHHDCRVGGGPLRVKKKTFYDDSVVIVFQ